MDEAMSLIPNEWDSAVLSRHLVVEHFHEQHFQDQVDLQITVAFWFLALNFGVDGLVRLQKAVIYNANDVTLDDHHNN